MSPVFEELAPAVSQRIERVHWIGAEPRKCRHVLCACEHVDRIDLEGVDLVRESTQVHDHWPRWSRLESLRRDRETACLGQWDGESHRAFSPSSHLCRARI